MDTLRWQAGTLFLLDQTKLPFEEIYLPCHSWQDVRQGHSVLAVRRGRRLSASLRLMPSSWRRGPCARKGEVRPF